MCFEKPISLDQKMPPFGGFSFGEYQASVQHNKFV